MTFFVFRPLHPSPEQKSGLIRPYLYPLQLFVWQNKPQLFFHEVLSILSLVCPLQIRCRCRQTLQTGYRHYRLLQTTRLR